MDLLKLKREEIQKVGYWSPNDGISITDPTTFYESNTTNITLIVITREVSVENKNMFDKRNYICALLVWRDLSQKHDLCKKSYFPNIFA